MTANDNIATLPAQGRHKGGRPSIYSPELAQEICARIAGGETLKGICEDDDMPCARAVLYWLHDDSPGRRRTHKLVGHTVPLVTRIVSLGSLPVLRTLTKRTLTFLAELREERDTEEE